MNVRKMYVVPSEFFDSLMRKSKITEDPLLTAQIDIETKKEQILEKHGDPDKILSEYIDATQKQTVLEEKRKTHEVIEENNTPKKPRGRPRKNKETFFEFGAGSVKTTLLDRFYDYDPRGKSKAVLKRGKK